MSDRCRALTAVGILCSATAAATPAHAQGTVLFSDDWQSTAEGQLPRSLTLVQGRAAVATREGVKFVRVDERSDLEIVLPRQLPTEFTIEFDMLVPHSTAYPVEIRATMPGEGPGYRGANLREQFVTAWCGAIRTAVYGGYYTTSPRLGQPDSLARSVHRCRTAVSGNRVEVSFARSGPVALDNVNFGRSDRIRLVVPATAGQEAYIGGITITGGAGDVTTTVAATPPQPLSTHPTVSTSGSTTIESTTSTAAPTAPAATAPAPISSGLDTKSTTALAAEAKQLFDAGISATAASAQLRSKYQTSTGELVSVFYSVGYTANALAGWLGGETLSVQQTLATLSSALPSNVAQREQVLAEALYRAYPNQAGQIHASMKAAGAQLPAVVQGLKNGQATLQVQAAALLVAGNTSVVAAADALRQTYQVQASSMVALMKQNGLSADVMMETLVDPYDMGIDVAIKTIGTAMPARAVLAAARKFVGMNMEQAFGMLHASGHTVEAIARAVYEEFQPSRPTYAAAMKAAGQAAGVAASVVMIVVAIVVTVVMFGTATAASAAALAGAIATAPAAGTVLTELSQAGYTTPEIVSGLRQGVGLDATQIADLARRNGFQAAQVMPSILAEFPKPSAQIPAFVTKTLRGGGFSTLQTATVLKDQHAQSAKQVGTALHGEGVPVTEIVDALVVVFNLTAAAATQLMAGVVP